MNEGKANQHPGKCQRCGEQVAAGAGLLRRREQLDGSFGWVVEHRDCEAAAAEPSPERPLWAVYGKGRTPEGNEAEGICLMSAPSRPELDAIPLNAAARRIVDIAAENG